MLSFHSRCRYIGSLQTLVDTCSEKIFKKYSKTKINKTQGVDS